MKVYLAGQTNFGNRGCEALVRSSAQIIKESMPNIKIICPLDNMMYDSCQWPEANYYGVQFVSSPKFPRTMKWWSRLNRLFPLESIGIPKFELDNNTDSYLHEASALIMTGGDNLTLDYGVMSLYQWCRMVENAISMGVPAVLWSASVGPFSERPNVEKIMVRHLRRYAAITVRESVTHKYLKKIGIENVELVADPAFCLKPEVFDLSGFITGKEEKVLGFNVSPIIRKFRQNNASALAMDKEIITFLQKLVTETEYSVILISHVHNTENQTYNSDWQYMRGIYDSLKDKHDRILLAPADLNAGKVKHLIGACSVFIGARTHSTIAALSQCIPTISIAYSVKARGINYDLFGHEDYVLNTSKVTSDNLIKAFKKLISEQDKIRSLLTEKMPEWRKRADKSVLTLKNIIKSV